ncbi:MULTISPECIES: PQQ-dependent sugar dehydrogenase [Glutamicibacter]|uniref:PQQ-dependent sugar dehydrogenase n=1 Tax=Glutamicibacter TaxID=1742989 RepID=UPI0010FE92B9|nr:PQQ-dependent sugar dehydrogenase [Glutamicibacter sp. V16R2B1]TLK51636.1 PQQ-dependent sugar dehydrogenase [Glutamicibacter sp. V16R2B1]
MRGRHCWYPLAALCLLLVACSGPAPIPPAAPQSGASPTASGPTGPSPAHRAEVTVITRNLQAPWSICRAMDTTLVSERDTARILEVDTAGRQRTVGTVPGVRLGGEGGLLGLAFAEPDQLYAYSTGATGNRIQRFTLHGKPGSLRLGQQRTVIDELPAAGIHNGGRIAFGPDGKLYAGVGDAAQPDAAQDPESLGGKILRLEPDGGIPADNPFPGSAVYSLGHRNVQGLAWDGRGRMYASEFGQNTFDELNEIRAGGNYGWPQVEGQAERRDRRFTDPIAQWPTGQASPSGIAIADGWVYLANLRGQRLRRVELANPQHQQELLTGQGRLRAVLEVGPGQLWVLTNNTDGRGTPQPGDDRIIQLRLQAPPGS